MSVAAGYRPESPGVLVCERGHVGEAAGDDAGDAAEDAGEEAGEAEPGHRHALQLHEEDVDHAAQRPAHRRQVQGHPPAHTARECRHRDIWRTTFRRGRSILP